METSLGGSHTGGRQRSRISKKGDLLLSSNAQLANAKLCTRGPGTDLSASLLHHKHEAGQGSGASLGMAPRSTFTQALAVPQQREALLLEQIAQLRLDRDQLTSHNQLLHRIMEAQSLHSVRPSGAELQQNGGVHLAQQLPDATSLSRKRQVMGISGPSDDASGPAFRQEPHAATTSGSSGDAFITGYEALLDQLVRLLKKLEENPCNSQAKRLLEECITQQRQCLLRLTEAGDAVPLLHVMEHIRLRQLQWSSHEVTHRHATALAAADLSWWQKEKLQEAAATYYQQMTLISVEGQAAAAALKQALDLGQRALGRTGEQYKAVQAAQQRLRDAHLAEAGVFWALSNHFIMKDTLEPEQAARLQAALGPMLLDVAVAGRLLLAERPSRYTHLSLPMPLPEPPAGTAQQQQQQQQHASPVKPSQPAHQREAAQQPAEQTHAAAVQQPQAELPGMLQADMAGLQAALRGQGMMPGGAAPAEAHFGLLGVKHPSGAQPPVQQAQHAATPSVAAGFPSSLAPTEQTCMHEHVQQQMQPGHAKHTSPTATNSSSSRASMAPTELARQPPGSAPVARPGSERGHMSPPPLPCPSSRASTPGSRDGPPAQKWQEERVRPGAQELVSHRNMLMMHHQMMVSQRQPAKQHSGSQQQQQHHHHHHQQQHQQQVAGRQQSLRHADMPVEHPDFAEVGLAHCSATAMQPQQQLPAMQRMHHLEHQPFPADMHMGWQSMPGQHLAAQQGHGLTAQQLLAQQLRQAPEPSVHSMLGLHARQSHAAMPPPGLHDWANAGALQLGREMPGSGLLQEPIWPEDGDAVFRGDPLQGHFAAQHSADAAAYFQNGFMEPNPSSLDDFPPILHLQ